MTERTWRDYDVYLMHQGTARNDYFHAVESCPRIKNVEKTTDRERSYVAYHEPEPCAVCHPEVPSGTTGDELVIIAADRHDTPYHRSSFCVGVTKMADPRHVQITETDADPCRICASEDSGGSGTIQVCPECDDAMIRRLVRSEGWTCRAAGCGATFDEPAERARQGNNDGPTTGLAAKLRRADPEDVSGEETGEPMTDGGSIDWPAGFDRTPADEREPNRSFEVSLSDAFGNLEAELRRQEVDDYRYEFDARARKKDQRPYSRANPDDASFVVRWTKDGNQYAVACDAYSRLRDNVHAVGKYINEKGRMQRRPVTTGKSEFANAQLPSGDEEAVVAAEPAYAVLGVDPDASDAEVRDAYRDQLTEVHPDQGGSEEAFREVQRAKEVLTDG